MLLCLGPPKSRHRDEVTCMRILSGKELLEPRLGKPGRPGRSGPEGTGGGVGAGWKHPTGPCI